MRVNLINLRSEQCPHAAELVRGHTLFESYGLTPQALTRKLENALTRGHGLVVADAEGELTGLAWYLPEGVFGRCAYLRLIVVAQRWLSRGVGSLMMDEVEARSGATATDLFLLVTTTNEAAQAFYERRGYVRVGRLDSFAAPGVDEYIYRKVLASERDELA